MLKQSLKTISAKFISARALSQFSFVQFRLYETSFLGLLSLTLMTLETSLNLTPSFKTSVDARVGGLVLNMDYLENQRRNFIQKNYSRKRRLPSAHALFSRL